MWEDPIVAEVRKIREDYAAQFNFDLQAAGPMPRVERTRATRPSSEGLFSTQTSETGSQDEPSDGLGRGQNRL